MAKQSAGILLYRVRPETEVLLVHPGGPFFSRKDLGSWTIPKGEYDLHEDPLEAAKREFREETGMEVAGPFIPLRPVRQKGGKLIHAWAAAGDIETDHIVSNTFEISWPPGSGQIRTYPEIDRAGWFTWAEAREKINERQIAFLNELSEKLSSSHRLL